MNETIVFKGNKREFKKPLDLSLKYKSNIERLMAFRDFVCKIKQADELNNKGKPKDYSADDIYGMLIGFLDIKYYVIENTLTNKTEIKFYIVNYDSPLGLYTEFNLAAWLNAISNFIKIKSITRVYSDLNFKFANLDKDTIQMTKIKPLKLPSNDIILAQNGILDLKNNIFARNIVPYDYHFTTALPFKILPVELADTAMVEIAKRIIDDWASGKKPNKKYLYQLSFSAIDGNGRQVYNIIKGGGGNGKSAFLNILEHVAGENYTVKLNIDELGDDNALEQINESKKLVIGHDMSTDAKLSKAVNGRLKQFITNEPFQYKRKYRPNALCVTNGLKIQSTNTDVSFFENTPAIKRRINVFQWTDVVYSDLNKDDLGFDLDALIDGSNKKSQAFYEAFIALTIHNYKPFDKFDLPEESRKLTDQMISDNDQVENFLIWMVDQELNIGSYPNIAIYNMYCEWLRMENPRAIPLKRNTFSNRFNKRQNDYNFTISKNQQSVSTIPDLEFNFRALNSGYFRYPITIPKATKYQRIEFDNKISDGDVDEFIYKLKGFKVGNYDYLPYKEKLILYHLIGLMNDDAIAYYQTFVSDTIEAKEN